MVLNSFLRVDVASSLPITLPHLRRISQHRPRRQINDGDCGGAPLTDQDLLVGYSQIPTTSSKPDPRHDGDLLRYQRINPESAPLANGGGGGSGATRRRRPKPTRRSVEEERGPAIDAETADLASFLARTSLDNHRAGGSSSAAPVSNQLHNATAHTSQGQGPNVGSALYTLAAVTQAPGLGNGVYFFAAPAIQGPNLGAGSSSGGGIAAPDAPVLKWGRKQRLRGHRDKHALAPAPTPAPAPAPVPVPTPTLAPEPELTPSQARRRSASKNKRKKSAAEQPQAQAEEEKLMPPPSAGGPIIIRDTSPRPTRAATRSHPRSVELEEPHVAAAGEQQQPAAKGKGKRKGKGKQTHRQSSDKAPYEAGGSGEQQQPAPEAEPKQPPPRRRQPPRKASAKEKGKAPVVPPHVVAAAMEKPKPLCPRVVVELTKEEIAEDWLAMTGKKLPKRAHHPRPNSEADKKIFNNTFPGQKLKAVNQRNDYKNSSEPQDSPKDPAVKDRSN